MDITERLFDNTERSSHVKQPIYSLMIPLQPLAFVDLETTDAEILRTFEIMFNRLPPEQKLRAEDLIMRKLSGLGDHVLTAELNRALTGLIDVLNQAGRYETASAIRAAQNELALSVGKLKSRSTRSG